MLTKPRLQVNGSQFAQLLGFSKWTWLPFPSTTWLSTMKVKLLLIR